MKILLINGSPKGAKSNSLRLAHSFLDGIRDHESERERAVEVEELHLNALRIAPCKGCFACWKQTPGSCCMKDDMQTVIEGLLSANLVIWSFPLYYYSVPGLLKNLIDRQLPMSLPFMCESRDGNGSGGHPSRYDRSMVKHVLISTCGFYSAEGNYDSVTRMFDHVLGQGKYTSIFCGQGELFRVKELSARTDAYLAAVRQAGREYAGGRIQAETEKKLKALLYPRDVFEKMADASWGISKENGEKEDESLIFTRQMAALYNKDRFDGRERVLEICYTDLGKTYRIKLGKDGAEVLTDESLRATTRIDTPFSVWLSLSRGEMRGDEALAKHLYTVSGDFSLMMNWDRYFGTEEQAENTRPIVKLTTEKKPPSMQNMLLAWIALWVAVSVEPKVGKRPSSCVRRLFGFRVFVARFLFHKRAALCSLCKVPLRKGCASKSHLYANQLHSCGCLGRGLYRDCDCQLFSEREGTGFGAQHRGAGDTDSHGTLYGLVSKLVPGTGRSGEVSLL